MNYCPNCGAPIGAGQSFCGNCGHDVREIRRQEQASEAVAAHEIRGLARNTLVYLAPEGLQGFKLRSLPLLLLTPLAPLPLLAGVYYLVQAGALAVYFTLWIVASALLYDELRRRGLGRLVGAASPTSTGKSWLVPWQSIRMADWNGRTLWFTSVNPRRKLSLTFDRDDAPVVERTLDSRGVRYSWRGPRLSPTLTRFWTLALLLFVTGQVILILAATLPFFPGEQQTYVTILNNTRSQIVGTTFIGEFKVIFLNNIQVAWGGALPFLGVLTYGAASYNTGRVIQAIAVTSQQGALPSYAVLLGLYLLPHAWVEESAYPIATVAGLLAFTKWRSVSPGEFARRTSWGSTKLILALGGAALILVVAGFIEVLTTYLGYFVVLLWAPLIVLYYLWTKLRNRSPGSMDSP
jgi:uncharacterized membrane protein SpoIIM required for sporulation